MIMLRLNPFTRQKSKSADNIKIVIDFVDDIEDNDDHSDEYAQNLSMVSLGQVDSSSQSPRKILQRSKNVQKAVLAERRTSLDAAVETERRPNLIGSLRSLIGQSAMKKSDQKAGILVKGPSKLASGRSSPQMTKTPQLSVQDSGSQTLTAYTSGSSVVSDDSTTGGASSDDVLLDTASDIGIEEVDGGDNSLRTKQVIEVLLAKIQKTKEAIKKEQTLKEAIVREYLQMTAEKQPTARIKALFEKKNQKSAQNIIQLQRKLENYQQRLTEVETHGYTGHRQAKEMIRDVGQGINTIVSKPKEFAHLLKNKFGSADNITQLKLDDPSSQEPAANGKPGGMFLTSDDEASSATSGSGPKTTHYSPHHFSQADATQMMTLSPAFLLPITSELVEVRHSSQKVHDILIKLVEEFEEYKSQNQLEVSLLHSQLEDERYRAEHLEEQLNDLTELHQHEMQNLKQDLTSMEEKIDYRLDERTTDLSDLMDNVSARISRVEQQQQQQQILSMEMVENATFRTIISKLINVVLAILAVVLVFVSTGAKFLSPFVNSTLRLVVSVVMILVSWFAYQNYPHLQESVHSLRNLITWPWS
ncbi:hypothetical protein BsWGS_14029 [Bradybaena similaris]